ncbi:MULTISPECIES: hypothetical protein [unclassified Nocardiopsis]
MIAILLILPTCLIGLVLFFCHVMPDRAGDLARIRAARERRERSDR